jgi:pyridoxine 5-phosphate synthase
MTRLSVNINKIATLRNARGGNIPNVTEAAINCIRFGADGITVHPRPDQRHIKPGDVYDIRKNIIAEFNIEGYPSPEFINMVIDVKPEQVTLVPDTPTVLTSNIGWDVIKNFDFLCEIVKELKKYNFRVSIFVDADMKQIEYAAKTGTHRIELYTEPYATMYPLDKQKAIKPFIEAAKLANELGLGLNSGHDLNLQNLKFYHDNIPELLEVSIGHALISDALYYGLENTIQMYKRQLVD